MLTSPLVAAAIELRLNSALSPTHLELHDDSHLHAGHPGAQSGGGHYRAVIVSEKFRGLSRIRAQQLVYAALADWMGKEIHALSMQTYTPEAWEAAGNASD